MTQAGTVEHAGDAHGPVVVAQHFDAQDLEQMDADDVQAGRAIGKMLALFFVYTVIATAGAALYTVYGGR